MAFQQKVDTRGVAALPDGYMIAGSIRYIGAMEGRSDDIYLVKTDLQGEVVLDTAYGRLNSTEQGTDVDAASNGWYYVSAIFNDSSGYDPDFCLICTDSSGHTADSTTAVTDSI